MDFNYESALTLLKRRAANDRSEEDVKAEIVEPVLRNALGYSSEYIRRENQLKSQRPDFLCRRPDGTLDAIVEAKAIGVNLDLRPSRADPAKRIPTVQLEEYLRKRPDSNHGVFGLLTNGEEWRVCRRMENDVIWLSSAMAPTWKDLRAALDPLLSREQLPLPSRKHSTLLGIGILDQISSSSDHRNLLEQLVPTNHRIQDRTELVSSVHVAHSSTVSEDLFSESHLVTVGSYAHDDILSVADVYDALQEGQLLHSSINAVGIGTVFDMNHEYATTCRVFMWDGSTLHTSNSFNPELPGTRVLRQLDSLARWRDGAPNDLIEELNAQAVQQEFYNEVASWFERTGTLLNDLRHLLRTLFTWFLKEHGVIPSEFFEKQPGIYIHEQLEHLFTQTLSMQSEQRVIPKRLEPLGVAFEDAPFLNGSLFNDDPNLLRTQISDEDYIRAGKSDDGLFTILKRYSWTLTEHDKIRSDTALDPSMIGSVFERFIALAENIKPGPLARQPDGTYYTPKDLTEEMVCDALAYDLSGKIEGVEYKDALDLLHPEEGDTMHTSQIFQQPLKDKVIERLREVTVLDPCTGSGEFIVSVLNTLRRSQRRLLSDKYNDLECVKNAVAYQLYAVDVHPMAIQVTRFRFYLAMIGTQLALQPNIPLGPFPNLETRFATANSLETRIKDEHMGFESSHLRSSDMLEWRGVRDSYTYAHSPDQKKKLHEKESMARRKLIDKLFDPMPHVIQWLENESLGNESIVSQCGIPLLFGRERWDVVIGNPPYQKPSSEEKRVAQNYGYKTTSCNDLYCLFVELGTKLIVNGGVLTMVVPHSICFAVHKKKLRDVCEETANSIHVRTYNNRPSAVFPPHPFIKGGNRGAQNAQRVSVFSLKARMNDVDGKATIRASCYIGLVDNKRKEILRCRSSYPQPKSNQWTMAGTEALSRLLNEMRVDFKSRGFSKISKTRDIAVPETARYFLTCVPQDVCKLEGRKRFSVSNDEYFWPRICLYNSTVFHAYWLMVGDAFHVLKSLFNSVRIPPKWVSDSSMRQCADEIGRELCEERTLNRSMTQFVREGKTFPNFNFQDKVPELILKVDRVCIKGYGLEDLESQLLEQIHLVRQFRTWDM